MAGAGYTPEDADWLRRSMAAWKRHGDMGVHEKKLKDGFLANGYSEEFADLIFERVKGFGNYGFPESHAASFALLAWQSAWLKCHEPAAFAAGLLNSQPMGFYSPSQIVQDVRRHGIEVRPVDVRYSTWECSLEPLADPLDLSVQPALRLGFCMIRGFNEAASRRIEAARRAQAFTDATDLCHRAALDARERAALADSGALKPLLGHRHRARWAMAGVEASRPLFDAIEATPEPHVPIAPPRTDEDVRTDYDTLGLTLSKHPLALLRPQLAKRRLSRSRDLPAMANGRRVAFAGLVTLRQRPGTAKGVTFVTLEDEDGLVNVVVWRQVALRDRRALMTSRLLCVHGHLESASGVQHLIARRLEDLTDLMGPLATTSRDFH
jgi:error-prone DNA polymerase